MNRRKGKKRSTLKNSRSNAFERVWKAGEEIPAYDSLTDKHASSYFASPSLQKHITHLSKTLFLEDKSKDHLRVSSHIRQSRLQMRHSLVIHENSENLKIAPYTHGLKAVSKFKLQEFKKNLTAKRKVQDQDHYRFLHSHWNTKKPDRPVMKVIRTLNPLESMLNHQRSSSGFRKGEKAGSSSLSMGRLKK